MSREEHNKIAKIENLIWEIANTVEPNSIIDHTKIQKAKDDLIKLFSEKT